MSTSSSKPWYHRWEDNSDITPELKALAIKLGYRRLPPRIDQFLADPKYLGDTEISAYNLYPAWGKHLMELFPTRLHLGHNLIALHCALGTGKTFFTTIVELYTECRVDHLDNQKFLRNSSAKELVSSLNHISTSKANSDYLAPIINTKNQSPYFSQNLVSHNRLVHKTSGERNIKNSIGGDVLFYAFSELEFWKYHKAKYALESAIGRINSRFIHAKDHFGLIVIDSSPSDTSSSVVNDFLAANPQVYSVEMSAWEAKAHTNYFFNKGEFFVYIGDQNNDPFILNEPVENLDSRFDKDKVIRVPEELRQEFTLNLPRALKDQAGITAINFGGKFIKDKRRLEKVFKLPHYNKDIITPDFYQVDDRLYDYLVESIREYPLEKKIYGRLDLGLTNDLAGLAFGYFDQYEYPIPDNPKFKVPKFIIKTVAYIGRLPGQETSIDKIAELIIAINKEREIGGFSSDSFQSKNLLQKLELEKIPNKLISVDRTNLPYNFLKNAIYNEQVVFPSSKRLKNELENLIEVNGKIDHITTEVSTAEHDGTYSKDGADAVSGLLYHMYTDLDKADKISSYYSSINSKEILTGYGDKLGKSRGNVKQKVTNDIIRNIFS